VYRIRFPPEADSEKQGKLGLDVGAPREALYSCMRERGKPADSLRSPPPFSNRIRHTAGREANMGCGHGPHWIDALFPANMMVTAVVGIYFGQV